MMNQKLPVLVTGGAGYIGSHAVLALLDGGWPVAVIDNLSTGFRFAIPDGVPFYQGDIADGALLARIFAEEGIGAIMHFAGSIIVPESVENPLKYYNNNTAKSRALIEAAVQGGVSAYVVDGMQPHRLRPIIEVAIARFREFQALRDELQQTRNKLAERREIEKAKGILMKQKGMAEEDAYQALRKLAMDQGLKIGEVARQLISIAKLLG